MLASRRTILPSPARRSLASTTAAMVRAHRRETGLVPHEPVAGPFEWLWQPKPVGRFCEIELDRLVLRSPRLTMRPWARSDASVVQEVMCAPAMHRFLQLP